jgi:hypothetical protein
METNSLIGVSFTQRSFTKKTTYTWTVTKENRETNYVYVEREDIGGKIGQWIPADWITEFEQIEKLRKKNDAIRKSRDYFKNERDELNERLSKVALGHQDNDRALIEELSYLKAEMQLMENDVVFWKRFSIYTITASVVLYFVLFAIRVLFY